MGKHASVYKRVLCDYKYRAKRRGIPFTLTLKHVTDFISRDCFYCGRPPSNVQKGYAPYTGIDRINNKKGYTPDNIVACCKECNQIKSSTLSMREMLIVAATLRAYRSNS